MKEKTFIKPSHQIEMKMKVIITNRSFFRCKRETQLFIFFQKEASFLALNKSSSSEIARDGNL
jgi:hypothetical protein